MTEFGHRRISLASGMLPEFDALTVAETALAVGYSDAGIMVRPDQWQPQDEPKLLEVREQGLGFLDVEVLWIPRGGELNRAHQSIVEVGHRLGADNLLVVSDEALPEQLAPALTRISEWCSGSDLQPCLEFLKITQVKSLAQTQELLQVCVDHNFAILIDALHLARSGEWDKLPDINGSQHPYLQLCDGKRDCADDYESLLADALDGRSAPGEGELDLGTLLAAFPKDLPLSLEIRSARYRTAFADPVARADTILRQTRSFLQTLGERRE